MSSLLTEVRTRARKSQNANIDSDLLEIIFDVYSGVGITGKTLKCITTRADCYHLFPFKCSCFESTPMTVENCS